MAHEDISVTVLDSAKVAFAFAFAFVGTLPDETILSIFADICSGVASMHSQNPPIAHRQDTIGCFRQSTRYLLCQNMDIV